MRDSEDEFQWTCAFLPRQFGIPHVLASCVILALSNGYIGKIVLIPVPVLWTLSILNPQRPLAVLNWSRLNWWLSYALSACML